MVVILFWDAESRALEYVDVNGGMGGVPVRLVVSGDAAGDVTRQLAGRELPRTAGLEAVDDLALIDDVSQKRVRRCAVRVRGGPGDRRFELRERGELVATIPAAGLGVTDAALAGATENLAYLYAEDLTPPGCWLGCEGGLAVWLEGRRRAAAERRAQKEDAARQREADKRFINPYTFVPFAEEIERDAPGGHHWLAPGRLSGSFSVTWEFVTAFQVPEGAAGVAQVRLPGSSVKGAVRSVHEALAGGCLRVFDTGFIPSYRDHADTTNTSTRTLAVVDKSTRDGQPLSVTMCDEVVWVRFAQLRRATGGELATGSRVSIDAEQARRSSLGRMELPESATVGSGGDWVVLVTDAGTRRKNYFLACGHLGERTAEVSESAWRAFQIAVAGARDMQPRENADRDPGRLQPMAPVSFNGQPVGRRRIVTGRLWEGDVLWVRPYEDAVSTRAEELSLAALWRHPGWGAAQDPAAQRAGSRVPPALLANGCRDPRHLCPSCRVFGSADPEARQDHERARQQSYAGHVRFGDACGEHPVELEPFRRPPLGAPRPGAGQFYLAYQDTSPASARNRKPTREWGSDPDAGQPRRLRGRKFYWHADPDEQTPPRHVARAHQAGQLVSTRYLAPPGTRLRQRVTFDNLSPAELGGLLAAFQPERVLGGTIILHLGGGKPLGLGSCTANVCDLRTWTAASRYGDAPEITPDPDAYVREFAEGCPQVIRDTWPALAAVLADGTADPARVWYPPGAYWPDRQHQEKFDKPFAFFTASSGMHIAEKGKRRRPLIPLPDPAAGGDQSLPILREEDLE